MRARLLDLAVATVCVACVGSPLFVLAHGASSGPAPSVSESGGTVDQRVVESGIISNPINGTFGRGRSGIVEGSIQWDMYTSSTDGLKLLVSSDRVPTMRDAANGVDVDDYGSTLSTWSVGGKDRRFGFSVVGTLGLSKFDEGRKWRGFDGKRPVEIGRRAGVVPTTRTTVRLRAEFAQALAGNARPTANIDVTAVPNL